MQETVKRDNFT